jgi:hypothetical protein
MLPNLYTNDLRRVIPLKPFFVFPHVNLFLHQKIYVNCSLSGLSQKTNGAVSSMDTFPRRSPGRGIHILKRTCMYIFGQIKPCLLPAPGIMHLTKGRVVARDFRPLIYFMIQPHMNTYHNFFQIRFQVDRYIPL